MRRIFGTGKQQPPPDLNAAIQSVESRGESVDKKIAKVFFYSFILLVLPFNYS